MRVFPSSLFPFPFHQSRLIRRRQSPFSIASSSKSSLFSRVVVVFVVGVGLGLLLLLLLSSSSPHHYPLHEAETSSRGQKKKKKTKNAAARTTTAQTALGALVSSVFHTRRRPSSSLLSLLSPIREKTARKFFSFLSFSWTQCLSF